MANNVQGPKVAITAVGARARVLFEGHEVADSDRALMLSEPGGPDVCYFPLEDVETFFLRRNDHTTVSPWGGAATWYTILRDARVVEDAAWSYEHPFDDAGIIAGHIAFAPEHVDVQIDAPTPLRHVQAHDPPYVD
ncbi:MAG: DUF427 domain-containing protein [Caulobacter sp.]|nr:DUF427 domain-containing protein [Caulobacter sp.]